MYHHTMWNNNSFIHVFLKICWPNQHEKIAINDKSETSQIDHFAYMLSFLNMFILTIELFYF